MPDFVENHPLFQQILHQNRLVVADFTASWCGPCQIIAPIFKEWAERFTHVRFIKVDVDVNQETTAFYDIQAMPTFLCFKNGQMVRQVIGANKDNILEAIVALATEPPATAPSEEEQRPAEESDDPFAKVLGHVTLGHSLTIRTSGSIELHDTNVATSTDVATIYTALSDDTNTCTTMQLVMCQIGETHLDLYCDEEGILKQLPVNTLASEWLSQYIGGYELVGPIMLAPSEQEEE